jgi:hypothetical protein
VYKVNNILRQSQNFRSQAQSVNKPHNKAASSALVLMATQILASLPYHWEGTGQLSLMAAYQLHIICWH